MGRSGWNKPGLTAVVASLLLLASCGGNGGATVRPSPRATGTPTPQVTELTLQDNLEAQLTIEDQPDWMTSGFGSIWVTRDEAGAVDRIDAESNKVSSTVRVGDHPCNGIVSAYGSVWVPSCSEQVLYRIDPKDESAEKIKVAIFQPTSGQLAHKLAAGAGAIWMMTEEKSGEFTALARIEPKTNKVSDVIPIGHAGTGVAASDDAVWVAAPDDGVVVRVDPTAKEVVAEIEGLSAPNFAAADETGVWVLSGTTTDRSPGDGSLVRIDPESDQVVAQIQVDEQPGQAGDIVAGEGAVWVRTQFTLLAKIDPSSNRLVERYTDQKGLGGVVADFGSVWLSDFAFNQVWRVSA